MLKKKKNVSLRFSPTCLASRLCPCCSTPTESSLLFTHTHLHLAVAITPPLPGNSCHLERTLLETLFLAQPCPTGESSPTASCSTVDIPRPKREALLQVWLPQRTSPETWMLAQHQAGHKISHPSLFTAPSKGEEVK